jgi:hypothetical protein
MRTILKSMVVILGIITILSSCAGSKNPSSAQHNRGVITRHFSGY